MSAPTPIPLTLLAGQAGAGKTRLLNDVLGRPALAGALVVLNETGRTPLLGQLEGGDETEFAQSSEGCLCCLRSGELPGILEGLLRKRDNRRMPDFSRLIIEMAGIGDPVAMLASVSSHPYLSLRFRLTGVVMVLGPGTTSASLGENPAIFVQIIAADHILLTGASDAELLQAISVLNPQADILDREIAVAAPLRIFRDEAFSLADKPDEFRRRFYGFSMGRPPRR